MSLQIKEIKAPIAEELQIFEKKFRESTKTKVALLNRIMSYVVKRKGKQMRPMFVLLSAKIFGPINEKTYRAASLIELLHTATLVHDDVVDDSLKRRSAFSVNALWKNKIAVLVGDYLLSKGLLLSIENEDFETLKIVATAVRSMSEGELLQMEKARLLDITEEVYYEIITSKTASLIASACAAGALTTSNNADDVEKLRKLGETIGIAFQIRDDLFDIGDESIGKPKGIDIQERKMTLPLIHALKNTSKSDKRRILYIVKNKNRDKKKVNEVIDFIKQNNGIAYAQNAMLSYKNKALELIKQLPQNEASKSLEHMLRFTTERKQ